MPISRSFSPICNDMNEYFINTENINEYIPLLKAGDRVLLSGVVFTARDAAHKRLVGLLNENKSLPIEIKNAIIYYCGPTPEKDGLAVGSAGPTTSSRMDSFTPVLIEKGLKGMIGKGNRSADVIDSMKKHGTVYFAAIGGAGALYSKCITSCEVKAFPEFGCESIKRLVVKDFPVTVAIDAFGNNMYR